MAEQDQPFTTYVRRLMAQLDDLTPVQRDTIVSELWAHVEDAAAEQGRAPSDPTVQATVMRALGPSWRLGHKLAQAYRWRGQAHISFGWRSWLVWVLASALVWVLLYEGVTLFGISVSGALMALLHVVIIQRLGVSAGWWRRGLLGFCGPWLIASVVYWLLPWESWPESLAERIDFVSLAVLGLVSGIGQWLVLRHYLVAAAIWIVVPFVTLLLSFIGMLSVNVALIPLGNAIGGWNVMFVILSLLFGLLYGAISGTALLALARRRPRGAQLA